MSAEALALALVLWFVGAVLFAVVWHLLHVWLRGDR